MDYKNEFPESFDNANKISTLIESETLFNGEENIFSIVGGWGTGKSKIKEILMNLLLKKKYKVIDFNAIEFEEKAQITSEIYNKISKSFLPSFLPFRFLPLNLFIWSKFHKFRAIAQLKKESNAQNLSTSFILGIVLVSIFTLFFGKLIEHANKSESINNLLISIPHFLHNDVRNPVFINKVIILIILILVMISAVDYLLKVYSGIIPRNSHVDILEKVTFKNKTILIIDEIDRISEESIKNVLNEVNTLKSLKKKNFLILLFFDKHAILQISNNSTKQITITYLQKFSYNEYIIQRYTYIKKNKQLYLFVVWQFINSQMLSFRDANRFEQYIENNFINLKEFIIKELNVFNTVRDSIAMLLRAQHISCLLFTDKDTEFDLMSDQKLSAELIIDNVIKLTLYLTFRSEVNNLTTLLKQLKGMEVFLKIVKIECYEINHPLFVPDYDALNSKLEKSSSIVMFVESLWYGLVHLNLSSDKYS